jgi:hypothetical protein
LVVASWLAVVAVGECRAGADLPGLLVIGVLGQSGELGLFIGRVKPRRRQVRRMVVEDFNHRPHKLASLFFRHVHVMILFVGSVKGYQ